MVRPSLLAALAALMLLSTGLPMGPAQAQGTRESDERRLRDQFADRDEYRTKLLIELQRRETLLAKQQRTLATHEELLQSMYGKLDKPISDDEEDAQPQQAAQRGPGGRKLPPETPQGRRAKDVETQIFKTRVARYDVAQTQKNIAELKGLLAHNPQRP